MKKTLKALLLALPLLLTACGGEDESVDYASSLDTADQKAVESIDYHGGSGIVKIMFHVDERSAEGKAYKARINAFNTAYKEYGLKASPIFKARTGSGADYQQQLVVMLMNDELPDIITFDAPYCAAYADAELLYDITDAIPQAEQNDFLSLNRYQNRLYGLPIQESSAGFFYNKNLFAQAGIDVSGYTVENPWTFAEFKDVCARLKNSGVTPVDMRFYETKDETATYLLYPFIYAAGGSFVSPDGKTADGYYNSQATKNGFQFFKDLLDAEYTSFAIGSGDFFSEEKSVGMYLSSGWTIPDLDGKYPKKFPNRDSWGLLPYPKEVTRASTTGSWSYGITNNHNEDKAGAVELLKWMASAKTSTEVTNATGMIPCRKSCNPGYAAGSPEKILLDQLAQTGIERPATVAYPTFTTSFSDIIYQLREQNVNTLVENASRTLQTALDSLNNN